MYTFGGIYFCFGIVLNFKIACCSVAVQNCTLGLTVADLQRFGVAAESFLHITGFKMAVSFFPQRRGVLGHLNIHKNTLHLETE